MYKKILYFLLLFIIIIILLNFLKKNSYENLATIPENIINKYSGNYYTKNSSYINGKYNNLLKLDLVNSKVIVGGSIEELYNKEIPLTTYISPENLTGKIDNYDIVIYLLNNNNIELNYKLKTSDKWISSNPPNVNYLKKIDKDNYITYNETITDKLTLPELSEINNVKSIFNNFKYNETINIKTVSINPNVQMLDRENIKVYYQYIFEFKNEDIINSFNFKSIKQNIDIKNDNMGSNNYGLEVLIPYSKDLEENNIKKFNTYINYINISIYYKNNLTVQNVLFINNKSNNITINYNDLLNTFISKINNNKKFCSISSTSKCKKYNFPYITETTDLNSCFNTLTEVANKCNGINSLTSCYMQIENESIKKNCYDNMYMFYNNIYKTNLIRFRKIKKKNIRIYNVLRPNNNSKQLKFKIISSNRERGPIKYGDEIYLYSVNKKRYNDNPNKYGAKTPFSFNENKGKYKLYIYPYDVNNTETYLKRNTPFILSSKKFNCNNGICNGTYTSNCGYYGCRVTNTNKKNKIILFNHGKGVRNTKVGNKVYKFIFN